MLSEQPQIEIELSAEQVCVEILQAIVGSSESADSGGAGILFPEEVGGSLGVEPVAVANQDVLGDVLVEPGLEAVGIDSPVVPVDACPGLVGLFVRAIQCGRIEGNGVDHGIIRVERRRS